MALRLIEMVLPEKDSKEIRELLKEHTLLEHRQLRLPDGEILVRILLQAEHCRTPQVELPLAGVSGLPIYLSMPLAGGFRACVSPAGYHTAAAHQ